MSVAPPGLLILCIASFPMTYIMGYILSPLRGCLDTLLVSGYHQLFESRKDERIMPPTKTQSYLDGLLADYEKPEELDALSSAVQLKVWSRARVKSVRSHVRKRKQPSAKKAATR
jgi:hypothetical protein